MLIFNFLTNQYRNFHSRPCLTRGPPYLRLVFLYWFASGRLQALQGRIVLQGFYERYRYFNSVTRLLQALQGFYKTDDNVHIVTYSWQITWGFLENHKYMFPLFYSHNYVRNIFNSSTTHYCVSKGLILACIWMTLNDLI